MTMGRGASWMMRSLAATLLLAAGCSDDSAAVGSGGGSGTGDGSGTSMPGDDGDADASITRGSGDASASGDTTDDGDPDTGLDSTGPDNICGDDVAQGNEDCDGSDLAGQDCTDHGFDDGTLACTAACTFDTSGCTRVTCGNDVIDGSEDCDGSALAGQDCTDHGFDDGTLACANDCTFDTAGCVDFSGDCCTANGTPGCGDLGCTMAICAVSPQCCTGTWNAACATAAASEPTCQGVGGSCPGICGDNVIEAPEICDGTALAGEDCITQGFEGGTLGCQPNCAGFDTSDCQNTGFGDCVNDSPASACQPQEQCVTDLATPPTIGVCTDPECVDVSDCPLAPPGGTAPVQCVDVTGEGINECILFCGIAGFDCPPGMECALGFVCAWPVSP